MDEFAWQEARIDAYRRVGAMLLGIRRSGARAEACLKVLIEAAASLEVRAPSAIAAPCSEQAGALAEVEGAALAAHGVIEHGSANLDATVDDAARAQLARRSAPWAGRFASGFMAASDGDMSQLSLNGGSADQLRAREPGRPPNLGVIQPAYEIQYAASFLAELNACAGRGSAERHVERVAALNLELPATWDPAIGGLSAHAFAVHYLTGIYGSGEAGMRTALLRFVASHPCDDRVKLQASRVAGLFSVQRERSRMALLDHLLLVLFPDPRGDPAIRLRLALDAALVLLLLDTELAEPVDGAPESREPQLVDPQPGPAQQASGGEPDTYAEIGREAEAGVEAAHIERSVQYQHAVECDSLEDSLAVVLAAAAAEDHEQACGFLRDVADRYSTADPSELVRIAPNVLGSVNLDSDDYFDGDGAGCFTVLTPATAAAAVALGGVVDRLMHVDELVTRPVDSLAVAFDGFEDLVGGLDPHVGAGVLVPRIDPVSDLGVELAD